MSDKLCVYGAKVHFFSDIYKHCIYIIFLKCFLLRFPSFVPTQILSGKRPTTNQGRTKERPKNSKIVNVLFIKIIPIPKKVDLIPEKVVSVPKKVDSHPNNID